MSHRRTITSIRWNTLIAFPQNASHRFTSLAISKFEKYTLDTHDHPVLDPVWDLYARAIKRTGETATLLEWDDNIPSFEEVHAEALKATRYLSSSTPSNEPSALEQKKTSARSYIYEPARYTKAYGRRRDAASYA